MILRMEIFRDGIAQIPSHHKPGGKQREQDRQRHYQFQRRAGLQLH